MTSSVLFESERRELALAWIKEKQVTLKVLGKATGLSPNGALKALMRTTMPTKRHELFVKMGFPEHLLPVPMDLKPGPKPKMPLLPQLRQIVAQGDSV